MEGDNPPSHVLSVKRRKESLPTTIYSLSEDLILTIFLCFPSLATLIRAAFTYRAWQRLVASSPGFCRRFRELHPSPLLGLFFDAPMVIEHLDFPAFPSFVPVRHRDRDLAAAVRGGDFFFTSIQEHPNKLHCWGIADCRRGHILLTNSDKESERPIAVLNPLVRRGVRFLNDGHSNAYEGYRGCPMECGACLVFSDNEQPTLSFKVVRLIYDKARVRATVFSSDTGEWSIEPWVVVPERPQRSERWLLDNNMQVNGLLYWVYKNHKYLVTLDTTTMNFSVEKLPKFMKNKNFCIKVGETNRGTPCIFYNIGFTVGMLLRRTDDRDGVQRWKRHWQTPLETQLHEVFGVVLNNYNKLVVLAVRDGLVYLALSRKFHEVQIPSWFFTMCLETKKLEKICQKSFDSPMQPYVMAWPPSLLGNFGRFALDA